MGPEKPPGGWEDGGRGEAPAGLKSARKGVWACWVSSIKTGLDAEIVTWPKAYGVLKKVRSHQAKKREEFQAWMRYAPSAGSPFGRARTERLSSLKRTPRKR